MCLNGAGIIIDAYNIQKHYCSSEDAFFNPRNYGCKHCSDFPGRPGSPAMPSCYLNPGVLLHLLHKDALSMLRATFPLAMPSE